MTTMVMGVGDAGVQILDKIASEKLHGLTLLAVNTHPLADEQDYNTLQIGQAGAGGDPLIDKQAAEDNRDALYTALETVRRLIIVGGFGGGTGTGAIPVIANYAAMLEIKTCAIVSLPFAFEGHQRRIIAEQALPLLEIDTDDTIVIESNNILRWLSSPQNPSISGAFALLDRMIAWHALTRI